MVSMRNDSNSNETHEVSHDGLVILFLSFAVLIGCVFKFLSSQVLKNKLPIPFTVVLLIVGFIFGITIANVNSTSNTFILAEQELSRINPHLLFYIFLPLLIFDSAFNSQFNVIRHQILPGIILAAPGVFISIVAIAICSIYIFPYDWNWLEGIMFGSILSATDPIAIVALLHESGAGKALAALIDLESLLNDGSAFVVFLIFKDIVVTNSTDAKTIVGDIAKFTLGGPAFGLGCGLLAVLALNFVNNEVEVEVLSTFGMAYLVFYLADVQIEVSAVLALVVMGLFMAKHKYCISSHVQVPMANIWHIIVYFANTLIFIITGLILGHSVIGTQSHIVGSDFGYSIVLYIAIHIGRLLSIVILYPYIKWSGATFTWKEYVALFWSGLRGSMSIILALIVKSEETILETTRNRMLFHICMIALFTLTINGTSSKYLIKLLHLDHGNPESEAILLQALEHMRFETVIQINKMKSDKQFSFVDWNMLNEYLPETLVEELDEQIGTSMHRRLSSRLSLVRSELSVINQIQSRNVFSERDVIEMLSTIDIENIPELKNMEYNKQRPFGEFVSPTLDIPLSDLKKYVSTRNEFIERFLLALSYDYKTQWYYGMIRRRTLYILVESVEKARHQHSLKSHWQSMTRQFRWPLILKLFERFNHYRWIKKRYDQLLFDHIFLIIELTVAFHSACDRINKIKSHFPELARIDERAWKGVSQETRSYQQIAAYMLIDLQQTYRKCWSLHATKRCAQILLKCESTAVTQLHETGALRKTEHTHISKLIENKMFDLEFYRIRLSKGETKAIENGTELLWLLEPLSSDEKIVWKNIFKYNHLWMQPEQVVLKEDQPMLDAFIIVRGIVKCKSESMPMFFRTGTIIGIDDLFFGNTNITTTYTAVEGLVEMFTIDRPLLSRILENEILAPLIYHQVAFHILLKQRILSTDLNRLHIKHLIERKARLYYHNKAYNIELKQDDRLFVLTGQVKYILNDVTTQIGPVQYKMIEVACNGVLENNTVLYTWSLSDELECLDERSSNNKLPIQIYGSISEELLYPDYSDELMVVNDRHRQFRKSYSLANQSKSRPSMTDEPRLEEKF